MCQEFFLSQHALQVVSQRVLQQVSRGDPNMSCRFPGPHPGGKFRGIWPEGSPGPHPRGKLRRSAPGGVCSWGVSAPGGLCGDPPGRLWVACIIPECILVIDLLVVLECLIIKHGQAWKLFFCRYLYLTQ